MHDDTRRQPSEAFSERAFYRREFRGRTIAIAIPASELERASGLAAVLAELASISARAVLISSPPAALVPWVSGGVVAALGPGLGGAVVRGLRRSGRVGVGIEAGVPFAATTRQVALALRPQKLVWIDAAGGLVPPGGPGPLSFVDLEELRQLRRAKQADAAPRRADLLRELEALLEGGIRSVNLCTLEGLDDELFTYSGSGTLFTRERYVVVRPLGLEDLDAAFDLYAQGVAEGYLAPRDEAEVDGLLAGAIGAFVEGQHLAGIGALRRFDDARAGEIAGLYTLTRFVGEGVGGHLVRFALGQAGRLGLEAVFACTTSERVGQFFERLGFERVGPESFPPSKWKGYDAERRARLHCFRHATR